MGELNTAQKQCFFTTIIQQLKARELLAK